MADSNHVTNPLMAAGDFIKMISEHQETGQSHYD